MGNAKVTRAKVQAYGFVIGSDNMPKVDDPLTVPKAAWDTLTQAEKNHVNNSVREHLRRYD